MRKIIIGLLTLTSISAFASGYSCSDDTGPKLNIENSNGKVSHITYGNQKLIVKNSSQSGISLTSIQTFQGTPLMNGVLLLKLTEQESLPSNFSVKYVAHTIGQLGMTILDLECYLNH